MIESKNNQIISFTRKLLQKKYRKESGLYLVEGRKLVEEAIRLNLVEYIVTSSQTQIQFDKVYTVADNVFSTLTDTINSQGVIAVVKMPTNDLCVPQSSCLILEKIQDAGNLGTIMRTAVATGYNDIFLIDCVDAYSPKVIRSASSAHFFTHIYSVDLETVYSLLHSTHKFICADMKGENIFNYTQSIPLHALIIGNEGNGISDKARQLSDLTLSLPMKNNLESLNAGVSAGVLMYILSNK
ncbi:MAG: RNA methyltransferase [Clostridia bacterium]